MLDGPNALDAPPADCAVPAAEDVHAALAAWLSHMTVEQALAANTVEAYTRDLRQLLAWLARSLGHPPTLADLASLDARQLRAFLAARRQGRVASRSLARSLSGLGAFFRWLEAEELAHNRAIRQVARPKVG